MRTSVSRMRSHCVCHREVRWHEVFLLVNVGNITLWCLLRDDGNAIGILCTNATRFGLSFLYAHARHERVSHRKAAKRRKRFVWLPKVCCFLNDSETLGTAAAIATT